jgi:hypothetical protein
MVDALRALTPGAVLATRNYEIVKNMYNCGVLYVALGNEDKRRTCRRPRKSLACRRVKYGRAFRSHRSDGQWSSPSKAEVALAKQLSHNTQAVKTCPLLYENSLMCGTMRLINDYG